MPPNLFRFYLSRSFVSSSPTSPPTTTKREEPSLHVVLSPGNSNPSLVLHFGNGLDSHHQHPTLKGITTPPREANPTSNLSTSLDGPRSLGITSASYQSVTIISNRQDDQAWTGQLPKLKVIHIELEDTGYNAVYHRHCRFISNLRPETVIIRNADFDKNQLGSRYLSRRNWSKLHTLIFISPFYSRRVGQSDFGRLSYPLKTPRLSRVFWIVDPMMTWTPQHDPITGEILGGGTRRIERHLLTELLEEFPGIPITIVNVGPSYRYCAPTLSSEEIFRENRRRYLGVTPWMDLRRLDTSSRYSSDESDSEDEDEEGGSLDATTGSDEEKERDAEDEQKRIRFVTLDEFLMEEDWRGKGWFDENEVEEWREAVEEVDRLSVPTWTREDVRPL